MDRRIYFDLSVLSNTAAGSSIHAWELCHRLMRLSQPLKVIPFTLPFRTEGKTGLSRICNAILRDTVWTNFLAGMEATKKDYFIFPNTSVPKRFYHLKYAVFVHDIGSWYNKNYLSWRGHFLTKSLPLVLENADKIFTVSDYTARDVIHEFKIPKEKVTVAPNGLSDMYKSDAPEQESINGIKLPDRYFLHVGTFGPRKNLSFLLKVYERFRQRIGENQNSFKLILTGGEHYNSSEIFRQLKNSPYVSDIIVLGQVKTVDLPSLYRRATAFIFPSIFEGFGIPVIEALSQGIPVLVNSNTALTQFSKFGATVFDNFDEDIWVNELKQIVDGKNLDRIYVDKVRNYFDWDRTAKLVIQNIYRA
jgi:glycosyltransferase involved in cell wall biosynthesis